MEILILLFDFSYFMLNFCNTIFILKFVYYNALIFILDFSEKSLIDLRIKNKHALICYCNAYFSFSPSQNGKTEYNYVNVLPSIFMPLFLIAESNLTYYLFSLILTSHCNSTRVSEHFFSQHVPSLSKQCTFSLDNGLDGRFIYRYWVRDK